MENAALRETNKQQEAQIEELQKQVQGKICVFKCVFVSNLAWYCHGFELFGFNLAAPVYLSAFGSYLELWHIFSMRTLNNVFVCLQPLSRSAVVDEESCADQVRPSASAAWHLAASRWGGRTLRSLLDQHPPRGPWAPRKRLRAEMNVVSSQRYTDVETYSRSKYIYRRQWLKV